MMRQRPLRVLVINQYYDTVEASGQLLRQLCEDLSVHAQVTVVAARPPGRGPDPNRTAPRVRWARATWFSRASSLLRTVNYVTFLMGATTAAFRAGPVDLVFCMTDPPMTGLLGLAVARARRVPFVLTVQDVHPDLGIVSGQFTNRVAVGILRIVQKRLLRHANRTVAISDAMRRRLISLGGRAHDVVVIPNWVDLDVVQPRERNNGWAREQGLTNRFTVMHSGNLGILQSLDTVVDCAAQVPTVDFVFVGEGVRKQELAARAAAKGLHNVRFLPHQPRSVVSDLLAAADAHIVSLVPGVGGYIEPSKTYGVMAAGRPMLAAVDAETEAGRLVQQADCGILVDPGNPDALAEGILELAAMPEVDREAMGARGREVVERGYSRQQATARYLALFAALCSGSHRRTRRFDPDALSHDAVQDGRQLGGVVIPGARLAQGGGTD